MFQQLVDYKMVGQIYVASVAREGDFKYDCSLACDEGVLAQLCRKVNVVEKMKVGRGKKHKNSIVACKAGLVYEIPVSCRRCYVDKTGHSIIDQLLKHKNDLLSGTGNMWQ